MGEPKSRSIHYYWWLIWLPVCSYVTFLLCWAFPRKSREKAEGKVTPSEEPGTRTTKQSFLFPPSNKGARATHPNYISAACHEWHSRAAKTNHIQKPECWAVETRHCQLVYLYREAKKVPTKQLLLRSQTRPQLFLEQGCFAQHNFLNKLEIESHNLLLLL